MKFGIRMDKIEPSNCYIKTSLSLVSIFYALSFAKLLYRNLVLPVLFSHRGRIRKYGDWIIITGATDGIGKGFAEILAKDGYNLVLISRTLSKLQDFQSELQTKYSIKIKIIDCDFTKTDVYERIGSEVTGLEVGLLINNVGMSYEYPDYLSSDSLSLIDLVHCNCVSALLMCRIGLSVCGMQQRGGYIINISSAAGTLAVPFLTGYSASKAFVDCLSQSLSAEVHPSSAVRVQNVAPYMVSTKMSRVKPSIIAPSARSYANSVLNRLGTCTSTHGCLMHELQHWVLSCLPSFLLDHIIYSSTWKMRNRALRKKNK